MRPWMRTSVAARESAATHRSGARRSIPRLAYRRSSSRGPLKLLGLIAGHQSEPEEVVRTECEQVRQLTDARERILAPKLERHETVEVSQVELDELGEPREVVDAENGLVAVASQEYEHAPVCGVDRIPCSSSECLILLAHADQTTHPAQQ